MDELARILKANKVKTKTLRLLFELDDDRVFALTEDGDDAVDMWEKLCGLVPKTGRWPVIRGRVGQEEVPTERKVYNTRLKKDRKQTFPTTAKILSEMVEVDTACSRSSSAGTSNGLRAN